MFFTSTFKTIICMVLRVKNPMSVLDTVLLSLAPMHQTKKPTELQEVVPMSTQSQGFPNPGFEESWGGPLNSQLTSLYGPFP